MSTNLKNQKSKKLSEIKYDTETVNKILAENEALKKKVAALEQIKSRGDHEIIVDGVTFRVNFAELMTWFDNIARGSIRQPGLYGAVGAHNAVAKILSLGEGEQFHEGVEKARQLLLCYAGN